MSSSIANYWNQGYVGGVASFVVPPPPDSYQASSYQTSHAEVAGWAEQRCNDRRCECHARPDRCQRDCDSSDRCHTRPDRCQRDFDSSGESNSDLSWSSRSAESSSELSWSSRSAESSSDLSWSSQSDSSGLGPYCQASKPCRDGCRKPCCRKPIRKPCRDGCRKSCCQKPARKPCRDGCRKPCCQKPVRKPCRDGCRKPCCRKPCDDGCRKSCCQKPIRKPCRDGCRKPCCRKPCDDGCRKSCCQKPVRKPCRDNCRKPCCRKPCEDDCRKPCCQKPVRKPCRDGCRKPCCQKRRCPKDCRKQCCKRIYSSLRVKCGCLAATLTVSALPTTYTAVGQTIAYTYTIHNVGTAPICYPITICDDILGGWIIPCVYIPCGGCQSFTRTYTIVAADLTTGFITNTASALIEVECNCAVCTPPATATILYNPPTNV